MAIQIMLFTIVFGVALAGRLSSQPMPLTISSFKDVFTKDVQDLLDKIKGGGKRDYTDIQFPSLLGH